MKNNFIRCAADSIKNDKVTVINDLINLNFVVTIRKDEFHYEDDKNSYFDSIYFGGIDIHWVYENVGNRDRDYERICGFLGLLRENVNEKEKENKMKIKLYEFIEALTMENDITEHEILCGDKYCYFDITIKERIPAEWMHKTVREVTTYNHKHGVTDWIIPTIILEDE